MVRQETWSYSTWFGKCSIHYAYTVSTLCSQIWLYCSYVLINISSPKLNNQIF